MGLFGKAKVISEAERRTARRVRIDCPATLLMPSGNRDGRLFDISEEGARFTTDNPPAQGCSTILEWPVHEAFARVIWSNSTGCGLAFDRPISTAIVNETAARAPVEVGRAAASGNIPLGRKRSRRPIA